MAVSTIFTENAQVWVAERGLQEKSFGGLEALKDYFGNIRFHGFRTAWEETCQDDKQRPMRACSKLMICVRSTRYGNQYVAEIWKDTGWRVYREQ